MEGLFNPVSIALHMFNAALLFTVLYLLLYRPVRRFMQGRSDKIAAALAEADARRREAEQVRAQYEQETNEARAQAEQEALVNAQQAKRQAAQILDDAKRQAQVILDQARLEAQALRKNVEDALHDQAATLAVAMAEKLLARQLDDKDNARLIDELLERL